MGDVTKVRCSATTKAGNACKNYAQEGSRFCHIHAKTEATTTADARLAALTAELDELVAELQTAVPETADNPYSPIQMLRLLRDNVSELAPNIQLGILENFQEMTTEDLMDIDTWKGMAYMMSYSARFQADQLRERMNDQLPDPFKPDTLLGFMKWGLDRVTPAVAKDMMANFEGATKEDFLDPDTWKGTWTMLNYSLQFQADQLKQRLSGHAEDEA